MLNHVVAMNLIKNEGKFDIAFLDNYSKEGAEDLIVESIMV
jgi:hypothetical protein